MKACRLALSALCAVSLLCAGAHAWHGPGHHRATCLAVRALPEEMPQFFREGADAIAHGSLDPDLFRLRVHPELRSAEAPNHFVDVELLGGAALPPTRNDFMKLCRRKKLLTSRSSRE